jgi:hypothetical protein
MACGSCGGGKSTRVIRSQKVANMKALRVGETKSLRPTRIRSGVKISKTAKQINKYRA